MHISIFIAITESTIHIAELAREVEARGFESLWVPEFTHVPVHRRTPLPRTSVRKGREMSSPRIGAISLIRSSRSWLPQP
jgi:hypothetical protein